MAEVSSALCARLSLTSTRFVVASRTDRESRATRLETEEPKRHAASRPISEMTAMMATSCCMEAVRSAAWTSIREAMAGSYTSSWMTSRWVRITSNSASASRNAASAAGTSGAATTAVTAASQTSRSAR